jgi:osmotically-inducible protein OsmY
MRTAYIACVTAMLGLSACASSPSTHYRSESFASDRDTDRSERASRNYRGDDAVRDEHDDALSERDQLITSKIREQFARDPQVSARDIDIDTYRGAVALSGYVDDGSEIHRAVKIALATPGVRTVRNDMRVARP